MDLIRPEVRTALWRWREVIAAAAVVLIGVWWVVASFGALRLVGLVIVVAAGAYTVTAVQRLRFSRGGGGVGVVHIDERRIEYFGPLTGGVVDLDDLTRLELVPGGRVSGHWLLTATGGQSVAIPIDAEGADALFDAFAALPGIRTDHLLNVLSRTSAAQVVVWQRAATVLRLH